jgi:HK97 gp10 family phage protein
MSVTVKVLNDERLLRKLRILPAAFRAEIKTAMAAQADEITGMMRRLAPVDDGDLRDSIAWRWGKTAPKGSLAVAQIGDGTAEQRGDLAITIYAGGGKAYYSRWVEFGTRKMAARPFFFVSWRANRKPAKNKIRAAVRKAAKQVAASG